MSALLLPGALNSICTFTKSREGRREKKYHCSSRTILVLLRKRLAVHGDVLSARKDIKKRKRRERYCSSRITPFLLVEEVAVYGDVFSISSCILSLFFPFSPSASFQFQCGDEDEVGGYAVGRR
ncbi:hypothetical protein EYC84_007680 [Monilinia fructicola]|uniref:Uncharacterized protein n=1 Tax=Monilinia fructicola TaxID=38448 RepID=A0A5M9JNT7_MONFR|nr:hypothetical protein EYC84_007680 [Monilinia fructicola]